MNKLFNLFILLVLVVQIGSGALGSSASHASQSLKAPPGQGSDLPGWPMPDKPIPHHEPGQVSKASSYTTQVTRLNQEGLPETVQIDGLDAMAADGVDPFAGNYTLVENDLLLRSSFTSNSFTQNTMTISGTITEIPGSQRNIGNYPTNDIAAGDLNGDGVHEQVSAWMGNQDHIYFSTGETPGLPGKTSSVPAAVASEAPVDGYALDFDGGDDYVIVGSMPITETSFTISFWAKRDSTGTWDIAVGGGTWSLNMGLHIGFRPEDRFTCAFYSQDLDTPPYTDADWHHWACTYNKDSNLRIIYRDGVMVAQDIAPADFQPNGELFIGKAWNGTEFDGLIDEVGIWSTDRSQESIQADAFRNTPDMTNLIAYWHFDEGSGTTASDSSGHGNSGTLVNGLAWSDVDHPQEEMHLLVRGYNGALWQCYYDMDTNTCLGWNDSAGGTWLSAPAVVSRGANEFDVFMIGADNQVYGRNWNLGWTGTWQQYGVWPFAAPAWSVPLPELPAPGAAARGAGVELFRLEAESSKLYWYYEGSWQDFGGMIVSAPAAISLSANQMQVFALGMDGAIWYIPFSNGWQGWRRLPLDGIPDGVTLISVPAAVSPGTGQIALYVRGSDNQVWSIVNGGSGWGTWTAGGGELASGPGAAVWSSTTHLFAQNADKLLQTSPGGLPWQELGGLNPCCTYQDTGIVPTPKKDDWQDYTLDIDTGYFWGDGRSQTVLAYFSASNQVDVILYDISDDPGDLGFTNQPVAQITIDHPVDAFRLITGDFLDHDGQDDIALAYLNGTTAGVDILRFSRGSLSLSKVTSHTYLVNEFQISLDIAAGDFDADGQDEIAVTTVTSYDGSLCMGMIHTWHYVTRMRVYDVDKSGDTYTLKDYYVENGNDWEVWQVGDRKNLGLTLAAGDVNGDGNDEILRTWIDHFEAEGPYCGDIWVNIADRIHRKLQVIDLPTNANPDANAWPADFDDQVIKYSDVQGYSKRTFEDRLASGDFDLDMVDEIVWQVANNDPGYVLRVFEYNPGGDTYLEYATNPTTWGAYPRLVTGDFTGKSIRVGSPAYRIQAGMTTPQVFLNLPPMHRDILPETGEVFIGGDWEDPDTWPWAIYHAGNTMEEKSTSESKRDWSISVGLEASIGGAGHTVTTSLDNTYGENFSNSESAIDTVQFNNTYTAQYFDQVIYNGTNYGVWEYPVAGVETSGPDQPATISVVFPLVSTTSLPSNAPGDACDENFYLPSHQPYNVWSYDRINDQVLFKDYDPTREIAHQETMGGGSDVEIDMSEVAETLRMGSFNNQINAGLEYSYENELNIPLIGKAWDFSFRASIKGQYGLEEISTLASTFTQATEIQVHIPSLDTWDGYRTMVYFYWAKAGYLVVDYQTEPGLGDFWDYYNYPDPAFILPWYGFPNEAGVFPTTGVDAPPCGLDKQLFTHDIEVDPAYTQNGEEVTLKATVRNFSNESIPPFPSPPVVVNFYLGEPAGEDIPIASCTINGLDRSVGPKTCQTTWTVAGASGVEKIFAVIDPGHEIDEMHDEGGPINNNVGYGLLYAANANYVDPGLRQSQAYQPILYEESPDSRYGLFVPTTNITKTVRFELVPIDSGDLSILSDPFIVGVPVQVQAFQGGKQLPDNLFTFGPTPARLMISYADGDLLPGILESSLTLYRLVGATWIEATCPGYEQIRFPDANAVAAPICQVGTYVLSAGEAPYKILLPLILR